MPLRDDRGVIEALASAELAARECAATWRLIAMQATWRLHEYHLETAQLRAQLTALRDEIRRAA